MRALKGLVVAMGLLIAIGFAVVVVTVVQRMDAPAPRQAAPAGAGPEWAPPPAKPPAFGDVRVTLPPGAAVVGTATDGGRLVVHLRLAGGAARVLVIDLASGRQLGTIDLAP